MHAEVTDAATDVQLHCPSPMKRGDSNTTTSKTAFLRKQRLKPQEIQFRV